MEGVIFFANKTCLTIYMKLLGLSSDRVMGSSSEMIFQSKRKTESHHEYEKDERIHYNVPTCTFIPNRMYCAQKERVILS